MDNDEFGQSYSYSESSGQTCVICNISPKDTTENPKSQFCTGCRERQIKYPVPKWIWAVLVVIAVAVIFASSRLPALLKDFKIFKAAETSYNQGYYNTAANAFMTISEANQSKTLINELLFLSLFKAQRFDEASIVLDDHLFEVDLSEQNFDQISIGCDILEKYWFTYDKILTIISDQTAIDDPSLMKANISDLQGNDSYDQSLVLYYLALTSETYDEYEQLLQQAYEEGPRYTFYLSMIGNFFRTQGNYDQATENYDKALTFNHDDEGALKGLGIICLIEGDKVKGLDYIQKAYVANPNGLYVAEAYAVALNENGRTDEAEALFFEITNGEYYEYDPTFENYFAGTGSLEAIYLS